jgi:hypothetical protein
LYGNGAISGHNTPRITRLFYLGDYIMPTQTEIPTIAQTAAMRRVLKGGTLIGKAAGGIHHISAKSLIARGWAQLIWGPSNTRHLLITDKGRDALQRFEEFVR